MNPNADIALDPNLSQQTMVTGTDDVTESTHCGLQVGSQEFCTPQNTLENLTKKSTEQMNININDNVENKKTVKNLMKRPIIATDTEPNESVPSKKSLHTQDLLIRNAADMRVINNNESDDSNLAKFQPVSNCEENTFEMIQVYSVEKTTVEIKNEYFDDNCINNDLAIEVISDELQESKFISHTIVDIPIDKCLDTKDTVYEINSFNANINSEFSDINITLPFDNISDGDMNIINQTKTFCIECGIFVDLKKYEEHVETTEHKIAVVDFFKERIDFNNYCVFSPPFCSTIVDFFSFIKEDFTVLVNYVIKKHSYVEADVNMYALYHDECSSLNNNKYLAEVKWFGVKNKVLTKGIDVEWFYRKIANSLMFQCETFQISGWSLEEIIWLEIVVTKSLIENKPSTIINCPVSYNKNFSQSIPVPKMRLVRCRPCGVYIIRDNYSEHINTVVHKNSASKYISDWVVIIDGPSGNRIKGYRILSRTQCVSLSEFFSSVESDVLGIVDQTLLEYSTVNMSVQLFSHYNDSNIISKQSEEGNILQSNGFMGKVKSFMMQNEILTRTSSLLNWYQSMSENLKSHNEEMLSSETTWTLDRIMFFEIYFYKNSIDS
ncbi:uncharacterized protein LOC126901045 isoform X3 [Daktulosphaira vitifoliae]|uniref:uncharacterized protein LOC126901045 isoform X3 n=1 Tax=Daktulosphaira vitifoliae TaxID=58002 RepID=UPI0021AA61BC|nr:uncharacterized protein LOC126901045 isoform X3 [Daktulosphaira vitifoliae]